MGLDRVLVAIPYLDKMHPNLLKKMHHCVERFKQVDGRRFQCDVVLCNKRFPKGNSVFAAPAHARNFMIREYLKPHHSHVMWIDADLVDWPPDLLTRLAPLGFENILAPIPLIEGTTTFYDVAAFIEKGQPVYAQPPHFGNVLHKHPWFVSRDPVVECSCVGCCYIAPADVFRSGVKFEPTGFTDHFPPLYASKLRMFCATYVPVYHACLPKYNDRWHSENMQQHMGFDFAAHGLEVRPGKRPDAGK